MILLVVFYYMFEVQSHILLTQPYLCHRALILHHQIVPLCTHGLITENNFLILTGLIGSFSDKL